MNNLPAPFSPLVSGGEGLDRYPTEPRALAARMAEIYGVPTDNVLPVRGATHGFELIFRLAARQGGAVSTPEGEPFVTLRNLFPAPSGRQSPVAVITTAGWPLDVILRDARKIAPALCVVDEGAIEFADSPSTAALVREAPNLVVVRSLSLAYGLVGARVGAMICALETTAALRSVLEPHALPEPSVRLAMQALDPSRLRETESRISRVREERARMTAALDGLMRVGGLPGPSLRVQPSGVEAVTARLTALGVPFQIDDALSVPVFERRELNDRTLLALGVESPPSRTHRTGQAVRDTKETRIVCAVDLDATGPVSIATGVGFFDHMLEQVAAHGGFSLRLACEGDLHTDPHHTIEDSAIALGQALKQALGERRGIARYGFVLPMDEANASVSIDLSGRPFPVFEGTFATPFIGDYRTDLTAHVFRSLAEHLGAAIHVSVTGDDDHHKTEAVYKAFGRALRQAIRIEGDVVPSTKGVL
ncbi:imidazoleglycerol-phosphate dehydratase HisB [Brevundimonas sp.]|uniref:imidazoleglycerol-phosphate dehydratase HisB n=1 Tax=Brevundimonas sp. TaxID=1871086 RepID=UPI0027316899|nr:imidazoleglycerol-phosphate dehydratase HisB [Brevundimonas sp.]MDP1913002.1 imidazoleglycerol-phosphate dehydratase HisB [Brevundimonas sp.]